MGNVTYLISNYGLDFLNLFALSKKPDGKTGFSDGDVITQGNTGGWVMICPNTPIPHKV